MNYGDTVLVKGIYGGYLDGHGVLVKPYNPIPEGYVMVLVDGMRVTVERERIVL